jgi:hypothetical protein
MHSVSFILMAMCSPSRFQATVSLVRAVGVPLWLAAHNQREAATIENSTSAMPVTTCGALRIK